MKNHLLKIASIAVTALCFLPSFASAMTSFASGDLIKSDANPAVYYFAADGKRYVFPTDRVYFSWYQDFSQVKTLSAGELSAIPLGGNVTYKPGVKMIKIVSDPKVYAVSKNGILRPIASEAIATSLYGGNWNKQIDDIADAFFVNYKVGGELSSVATFDKARLLVGVPSINVDKLLTPAPAGFIDHKQNVGFTPANHTLAPGSTVTWIAVDDTRPFVASNPHPIHTDQPGLQSGTMRMGETFSYTFTNAGSWGYHDHNSSSNGGVITIK
jgi:plastocyanin